MQNMWNQFYQTGMVADYLSYCKEREEYAGKQEAEKQAGVKNNVTGSNCDGNDTIRTTYR